MKKWKIIRNVTLAILLAFALLLLLLWLGFAMDDAVYPDAIYGLSRWESFALTAGIFMYVSAVPLLLDFALLVLSLIMLRKDKRKL